MGLSGVVRTMCTVARVTPHSDVRASVREGRLVHAGAGVTAGWWRRVVGTGAQCCAI